MSNRDSGEVVLSFLLGALVGAALGILYAPRSGKETRMKLRDLGEDLGDKINDIKEEVVEKAEHIVEEGKEKLAEQKERFSAAFDAGKKAYDKTK
jgi:gas vesicle protein